MLQQKYQLILYPTEEEIQQAEAASFAMAASITQIGHDGQVQHLTPQQQHVVQGQHLNTQLQQHLLQQVNCYMRIKCGISPFTDHKDRVKQLQERR